MMIFSTQGRGDPKPRFVYGCGLGMEGGFLTTDDGWLGRHGWESQRKVATTLSPAVFAEIALAGRKSMGHAEFWVGERRGRGG
jgi:hypothetical protein